MLFIKNVSQGKKVNEQEHLELLEKMKQFQQQKNVTYLKGATVEQVLKELENCDEVVVTLKDDSILRVRENVVFINGILSESIKPTDTETGSQYIVDYKEQVLEWSDKYQDYVKVDKPVYTNIPISNNYTGKQKFVSILEKYLD